MPFTQDEKLAWHERKRAQERQSAPIPPPASAALCVSCQNPFGIGEGIITDEAALCDLCAGD